MYARESLAAQPNTTFSFIAQYSFGTPEHELVTAPVKHEHQQAG